MRKAKKEKPLPMTKEYLESWIADTEKELETCPPQHKAGVRLRLDELKKKRE